MTLDHSPLTLGHERTDTTLDHSPLKRYIDEYLVNCVIEDKKPGTVSTYSQRLYDMARHIRTSDISPVTIRTFFYQLQERGLAPATRNAYYRSIRTFFNWLINEGYLTRNPLSNIKPPPIPQKVVEPFSDEDIRKLLILTSGTRFLEVRNRAMLLIFLDTGLRLEEMASLQRPKIDIITGVITLMGKGSKERRVRIGKTTRKALHRYLSQRDDNLPALWLSEERRPMTRHGVQVTIKHLCWRASIKGGPHKLRHTAAIKYLRNGGTEFTLQLMLGHSTLTMTRHYSRSLNEDDMMRVHEIASPVDRMKLK